MSSLPNGWVRTPLKTTICIKYGKGLKKEQRTGQGYPVYGSNGVVGAHDKAITNGTTIIIGRKGSIGEVHLSKDACWPIDTTYFIDTFVGLHSRYWYYFFKSLPLAKLNKATAIPGINREDIYNLSIPIPPLNEQERISDKLDQLFSEIDSIKTRLGEIPDIIDRLRQRLIDQIFFNIHKDRSKTYAHLKDISNSIGDGDHQAPPKVERGVPFLVISNIRHGTIALDQATRFVSKEYYNSLKEIRIPRKGDILYSVTGSIGIPAIVESDSEFCFQRHIAIIKPNTKLISPKFLFYYLKSSFILEQAEAVATGTAQVTVPLRGLRNFQLKVPSVDFQQEMVKVLDARLELANQIEEQYSQAKARIDQIMSSILKRAFRGELVSQNPSDEHASALLEKIKNNRVKVSTTKVDDSSRKVGSEKSIQKDGLMMKKIREVLAEHKEWLPAQEVFQLCGIGNGAQTEEIETLYAELRYLDKSNRLEVDPVYDADGRKQYDRLKLRTAD